MTSTRTANLGQIIFDGIPLRITKIELKGSQVWFEARSPKRISVTVDTDADFQIFAPDGSLVAHVFSVAEGKYPAEAIDGYLRLVVPLNLNVDSRHTSDGRLIQHP